MILKSLDVTNPHWARFTDRFGKSNGRFVTSLLGVTRLFTPELVVMLEATAVG
jgi:hypothetical protein